MPNPTDAYQPPRWRLTYAGWDLEPTYASGTDALDAWDLLLAVNADMDPELLRIHDPYPAVPAGGRRRRHRTRTGHGWGHARVVVAS